MKSKVLISGDLPMDERRLINLPRWIRLKIQTLNWIELGKSPFKIKIWVRAAQRDGHNELVFRSYVFGRNRKDATFLHIQTNIKPIHKHEKAQELIERIYKDAKHLLTHEFDETFQVKIPKRGIWILHDPHSNKDEPLRFPE
jgi:hypothetical protein